MKGSPAWLVLCLGLFACAVAGIADAKVLIVHEAYGPVEAADNGTAQTLNRERNLRMIESLIASTGGTFVTIPNTATRTEWIRTGAQVWHQGTSSARVEQFDAVVFVGGRGDLSGAGGRARPDSAVRVSRGAPRVPFVWFPDNAIYLQIGGSAGVTPGDTSGVEVTGTFAPDLSGIRQYGTTNGWTTMAYTQALALGESSVENDIRPLLTARGGGYYRAEVTGVPCAWCDSTNNAATGDTLFLVKRTYPHVAGAMPLIVASAWGAGAPADSASSLNQPAEGDLSIILAALAVADSAARGVTDESAPTYGGSVLGPKQIIMAPVVADVASRGSRRGANGIFAPDTSAYYAILDSLRVNDIRVTALVNVDSADAFPRDLQKWRQVGTAHFAPCVTTGTNDTTVALGALSRHNLVDVMGRYRTRVAIGADSVDCTVCGDTSLVSMLRWQKDKADSLFGHDRVSRILFAPYDDWSPLNVRQAINGVNAVPPDSIFIAARAAGYVGVCSDAQDPDANGAKGTGPARTNPRGYINTQQNYSTASNVLFRILTHSGFPTMGGRAQYSTYSDSTAPFDSGAAGIQYIELARAWTATTQRFDNSFDIWPSQNTLPTNVWPYWANNHTRLVDHREGCKRGNILMFHASDFSGVPNGPPAANGYHTLKSLRNAFSAINTFAGRQIVRFGYPDEIRP